jgi:hypothetical protein
MFLVALQAHDANRQIRRDLRVITLRRHELAELPRL